MNLQHVDKGPGGPPGYLNSVLKVMKENLLTTMHKDRHTALLLVER